MPPKLGGGRVEYSLYIGQFGEAPPKMRYIFLRWRYKKGRDFISRYVEYGREKKIEYFYCSCVKRLPFPVEGMVYEKVTFPVT